MKWPLNDSNFTFLDRLKIAAFFLNKNNRWTMSTEVEKYERVMRDFVGTNYAVFVSSGSTANTILAMYLKDKVYSEEKKTVVFPSTTWITSVSPFIREGFTPKFIDINLTNLSIDITELEKYLKRNHKKVACVFVTALLGFTPDIETLIKLEEKYKVKIMLDNCESTFSGYDGKNISSYFTSTTSTYFGHQLQSVEGGFIFTNKKEEYDYFLMARNHGMVRGLKDNHIDYMNPEVDSRFDFNILGNNFRNTDINAFIGLLDHKRFSQYIEDRCYLYSIFQKELEDVDTLYIINMNNDWLVGALDVPFSIPLIFRETQNRLNTQQFCDMFGIETRPIISGNLLRQTCLKGSADPTKFKNSEFIHANGLYVGLHSKVKEKDLRKLIEYIKSL